MKFVITMAGRGNRFKNVGIEIPKHRLSIGNRTMFDYAMSSLERFYDHQFVFVCRADRSDKEFIRQRAPALGIEDYAIHEIKGSTDGQATTALRADSFVDDTEPVAIYNIDTYVEEGYLTPDSIDGEAWLPVFRALGDRWSFVELDEKGDVRTVSEKNRISDLATIGLYHFSEWELFKKAYEGISEDILAEFGEKYICPLYRWLIERGLRVRTTEVPSDSVHVLGTPRDVVNFYPVFADEWDLSVEVDQTGRDNE